MRLFWQHGYERTSIADLTRELDISAPSLYAAFGDKRALFEEAVARYEASPESVTTAGLAGSSPAEVLGAMFAGAVREYASTQHPHGCLVNSSPDLAANRAHNRELTAARLHEVASSSGTGIDPETLSAFAHVVLTGLSTYARDGATEDQLRRITELAARVVEH